MVRLWSFKVAPVWMRVLGTRHEFIFSPRTVSKHACILNSRATHCLKMVRPFEALTSALIADSPGALTVTRTAD